MVKRLPVFNWFIIVGFAVTIMFNLFIINVHQNQKTKDSMILRNRIENVIARISSLSRKNNFSIFTFHQNYCKHIFGDIAIVQVMSGKNYIEDYIFNALQSMRCYAKLRNYTLYQIIYDGPTITSGLVDGEVHDRCKHLDSLMGRRHCVVAHVLSKHDFVIHIDADSGVVNPRHCFEDYLNPHVDMSFLVRAHSGEVQAGHYIAKRSKFSRNFLDEWANTSKQIDQASLHALLSKSFLPSSEHEICNSEHKTKGYGKWVACIRKQFALSQNRIKPVTKNGENVGKILLYSRAQTFVRDGWTTGFKWADYDFMFHAMKGRDDVSFTRKLKHSDCPSNSTTWELPLVKNYYVNSLEEMKGIWKDVEAANHEKYKDFALINNIANCWPSCAHVML